MFRFTDTCFFLFLSFLPPPPFPSLSLPSPTCFPRSSVLSQARRTTHKPSSKPIQKTERLQGEARREEKRRDATRSKPIDPMRQPKASTKCKNETPTE
ncbi:hypothetical protein Mapa_006258 [Marchantia paleacea]|nr:hypothetical protein Mapa_006258 [Marchantia paleacea]